MPTRTLTRFTRQTMALLAPRWLAAPLAAVIAAGCGAGSTSSDSGSGGRNEGGAGSASTGTSAGGAGQGGGSSASSGASGTGGSNTKCASDADCAADPKSPLCDVPTGKCVQCLPAADTCPQGQFCDPATYQCKTGCTDDTDCSGGSDTHCNIPTNTCVACLADTDCAPGTICIVNTCVPGCSPTQDCPMGQSCCGANCYDLQTNIDHCGDCLKQCEEPVNAAATCVAGVCGTGACTMGFADCDGDIMNGCEQNVLQDGDCLCMPGQTQKCYYGAPGSENIGPCKAGTQTCDESGTSWGACVGAVLPSSEICANQIDEDCDGVKDNAPDVDGDGWTSCNGDCCETPGQGCTSPKLVNPGAFEVLGNGVNDDCDAATSDVIAAPPCSTVADFSAVTASDVAKAMDICQTTTANASLPQKKWGLLTSSQLHANGNAPSAVQLSDIQNWQTAILVNYGTAGIVPKKGLTMAGISTGRMRDQNDPDYLAPNGGTDFARDSNPPATYLLAHGGVLPSSAGCSGNCPAGAGANDSVNVRLSIRVPTNAQSFSYDFRFISSEYWTYSCSLYNDFYLALLQTGANGIPADKNISFDGVKNPVSVNNGFFDVCVPKGCYTCPAGSAELAGTGMQLNNTGGATKWLTTDAPIVPGETMQLELMIFDVSDNVLDSLVLLDNFRWNLTTSVVGTHE